MDTIKIRHPSLIWIPVVILVCVAFYLFYLIFLYSDAYTFEYTLKFFCVCLSIVLIPTIIGTFASYSIFVFDGWKNICILKKYIFGICSYEEKISPDNCRISLVKKEPSRGPDYWVMYLIVKKERRKTYRVTNFSTKNDAVKFATNIQKLLRIESKITTDFAMDVQKTLAGVLPEEEINNLIDKND